MDNIQKLYLVQLYTAQQRAAAGSVQECLDICFELRLKPDLALATRALVYVTICNLVAYSKVPEKVNMAADALRLARELKAQGHSLAGPVWIASHDELDEMALKALSAAQEEQSMLIHAMIREAHEEAKRYEAGIGTEMQPDHDADKIDWRGPEDYVDESVAPVQIEGNFTSFPRFEDSEESEEEEEQENVADDLIEEQQERIEGLMEKGEVGAKSDVETRGTRDSSSSGNSDLLPLPSRLRNIEGHALMTPAPTSPPRSRDQEEEDS